MLPLLVDLSRLVRWHEPLFFGFMSRHHAKQVKEKLILENDEKIRKLMRKIEEITRDPERETEAAVAAAVVSDIRQRLDTILKDLKDA